MHSNQYSRILRRAKGRGKGSIFDQITKDEFAALAMSFCMQIDEQERDFEVATQLMVEELATLRQNGIMQ